MIKWWRHHHLLEFVEGSIMEVLWFVIKIKTMCVGVVWVYGELLMEEMLEFFYIRDSGFWV
jgi:hypothetical protein